VQKALEEGKLVIFDIDVQGHRLARERMGEWITSAFITPPTLTELERRLRERASDAPDVIDQRLRNAREEIRAIDEFDYVLINDDIDEATEAFVALARTARLKMGTAKRQELIAQWM
jgi:guanylate kinase